MDLTVLVFCTCPDQASASRVAQTLVSERLAACVNVLPSVTSVYRWHEAVETATEHLLLIKTAEAAFSALRDRITELHSYDTPEIIAVPITAGSEKYLSWLVAQV
jgi:periplasmic divalent cation tolerance protein